MNRFNFYKRKNSEGGLSSSLLLMTICLIFLAAGNILYHSQIFPISEGADIRYQTFIAFYEQSFDCLESFILSVILAARHDICCVLLIAFSRLTKIPRFFVYCIFSYRSLLFGFCGAYIIGHIGLFSPFWHGSFLWLTFFVYHIFYFAILICFAEATLRYQNNNSAMISRFQYALTVFAECALVILINLIYCFLISKI